MNVDDLKKMIANLPGNTLVVGTAFDHKYRKVHGCVVKARVGGGLIQEHYEGDDELMEDEKVIEAFLID